MRRAPFITRCLTLMTLVVSQPLVASPSKPFLLERLSYVLTLSLIHI